MTAPRGGVGRRRRAAASGRRAGRWRPAARRPAGRRSSRGPRTARARRSTASVNAASSSAVRCTDSRISFDAVRQRSGVVHRGSALQVRSRSTSRCRSSSTNASAAILPSALRSSSRISWVSGLIRHGRCRPRPPGASSTKPYFASVRRWNDALAGDSPISSPAWVAVIGPSASSSSSSANRVGWLSARSSRGSESRRCSEGMFRSKAFERLLVNRPGGPAGSRTAARAGARPAARRRRAAPAVGPSATIRPSDSTTERGHSCSAYGRSWVTISTVTSSRSRISASSRRDAGSRLLDGSSSTSTSGSMASTVATATRRRWPKLRWCGGRSAASAMPDLVQRPPDPRGQRVARSARGWPGRRRRPRRRWAGRAGRPGPGRRCRPGGGPRAGCPCRPRGRPPGPCPGRRTGCR